MDINRTIRKCLSITIIFLFVGTCFIPVPAQDTEKPSLQTSRDNWLYVGGSGPGNYTKIQDAIDNASDGDTIFVYSGTYYETITINKKIKLVGEDKYTTFIDAEESFLINAITVYADDVEISGFTISNTSIYRSAIDIYSNNTKVYHNILTDCSNGICLGRYHDQSEGNTIKDNVIYNNKDRGIFFLYCKDTLVENCDIYSNRYEGIWIWVASELTIYSNYIHHNGVGIFVDDADGNNKIEKCDISNNTQSGIWASDPGIRNIISNNTINNNGDGIFLDSRYADIFTVIKNNHIQGNHFNGIKLMNTNKNDITKNEFIGNKIGIMIWECWRNNIIGNNFTENIDAGIDVQSSYYSSTENNIYINNFFRNRVNAKDVYSNFWFKESEKGNHWDDYTGIDANGDGIGDTPYLIPGGSNQDKYPLMEPYGGNSAPDIPTCKYVKFSNKLVISTTDIDGDQVKYGISWNNDGNIDEWTGFYDSGDEAEINCGDHKGTVGINAKDEHGALSSWNSVKSKAKSYTVLVKQLDLFPNAFPLLRQLIGN